MSKIKQFIFLYGFLVLSSAVFALPNVYKETPEIKDAAMRWEHAILERNPEKIVSLYDDNAFLYATFQNVIEDREAMIAYFTKLSKHPNLKVKFIRENIRIYGDVAVNSGLYEFSYLNKGKEVKVPGRYTFVYLKTEKGWMIIDHHSSVLPEKTIDKR